MIYAIISSMFKQLLIVFLIKKWVLTEVLIVNTCSNNLTLDLREKDAIVIHATRNSNVILKCNYCDRNRFEEFVRLPKVWMQKPVKVAATFNEISSTSTSSGLHFLGKLYVNESDSSLVIRDVSINDTGFYYCLLNWKDNQTAKPYFLDIVKSFENVIENVAWVDFWRTYIAPVSKKVNPRSSVIVTHIVTEWTDWSPCFCVNDDEFHTTEIRQQTGLCLVKFSRNQNYSMKTESSLLLDHLTGLKIACQSLLLYNLYPNISYFVNGIPYINRIEECQQKKPQCKVTEATGNQMLYAKKEKKVVVLQEDSYASFVCPRSQEDNGIESDMIWKHNGKQLVRTESKNNHYVIDEMNNLFLLNVQKGDEGAYVCETGDGLRIRKIRIRVQLKETNVIFTNEFNKHMYYLTLGVVVIFIMYLCSVRYFWSRELIHRRYKRVENSESD